MTVQVPLTWVVLENRSSTECCGATIPHPVTLVDGSVPRIRNVPGGSGDISSIPVRVTPAGQPLPDGCAVIEVPVCITAFRWVAGNATVNEHPASVADIGFSGPQS